VTIIDPATIAAGDVLAPETRLGPVELTVTSLERSIGYYETSIGLRLHRRENGRAALGAGGDDVVLLVEQPDARPAGRHAGLYHYCLLHPSRLELARAARRLALTRTPIDGASDHGTHEAIYLPDPDGNGIELAADRPRDQWPKPTFTGGGPHPLDLHSLFGLVSLEPEPPRTVAEALAVGHVHLHVNDLDAATRFYRDVLGFELQFAMPSAVFVSAGGYHHHVGFNIWRGEGIPPVPGGVVGLRRFAILLRDEAELAALRRRVAAASVTVEETPDGLLLHDPAGNALVVRAA
jgi:catechol 2,3-dioxygenase